jgi:hypothetical protein
MGSSSNNNGSYEFLRDEDDASEGITGSSVSTAHNSIVDDSNDLVTHQKGRLVSHEKQPSSQQDSLISAFNTSEQRRGDGTFAEQDAFVEIHFAEIPKEKLTYDYVKNFLISKKDQHRTELIEAKLALAITRKAQVRAWGASAIKKMFLEAARFYGLPAWVMTFGDIRKWWVELEDVSQEDIGRMQNVQYGWFEKHKKWSKDLEVEFMMAFSWKYSEKTVTAAMVVSDRPGLMLKGCIEQTFSYMKGDFMKQIQAAGSKTHGVKVSKSRPTEQTRNENGKYIKLKPGEYTVQYAMKPNDHEPDDDGKKVQQVEKTVCMFYAVI